ncbi:NAD(P)H-hydrate dehydratase [Marinobacter litoralis]|uniref:NAD(P)H-hydrate dehydratase n=1 Tax=Marinobacter litoralis TaxID=187981 RepID=UPI0018EC1D6B|nr:NAD(P)H-hydrate dehydratase [Marinobacter litoralis]MBJ6137216.1 NAD(P)H-hydrate dehydratase [Marinobacter litoralis]
MRYADSLPEALYSADSVRAMDRYLIDEQGIDGFDLMQAAARAGFRQLRKRWPSPASLLVLCGAGNNGGDGYLIAANAQRHGIFVECIAVATSAKLSGDALKAFEVASREGVPITEISDMPEGRLQEKLAAADVVVDAMLGTGVTGAPRAPFSEVIRAVNEAMRPVLAVDLPSGLDASTGAAEGDVLQAELTVTFIGTKIGLYTGGGPAVCGNVVFEPLATREQLSGCPEQPVARLAHWRDCRTAFPSRPRNAHKGHFGHVLIVAGESGYGGAGIMAAEAASRAGAGLVSLATRPEHVTAALVRCPSVMVRGVVHGSELTALIEQADVIVCGPGIGKSAWGQQMLQQVLDSAKPRVLDADALNMMATRAAIPSNQHVLTPHPGEAARMLGCSVAEIEADRLAAAQKIQRIWGGVVLLKGAGTVIATNSAAPVVVAGGNPGMATGGMGDVLSGMLGAFMGQLTDIGWASVVAASAHLAAGGRAAERLGYKGVLPTDVIQDLPFVLKETDVSGIRNDREDK